MKFDASELLSSRYTPLERVNRFREVMSEGRLSMVSSAERIAIYRAMDRLGEVLATEKLAEAYESGIGTPRNLERADRLWGQTYRRHLGQALRNDRWAMLKLGDCYALGRGCPRQHGADGLQRNWRLAWSWWLKAASSKRPFAEVPNAKDFPHPLDYVAQVAVLRLADTLEFGKGRNSDQERARVLYALAALSGNASAAAELSQYYWRQGTIWLNANERSYGNRLLRKSNIWLRSSVKKKSIVGALNSARRLQFYDIAKSPAGNSCNFFEGTFCPAAQHTFFEFHSCVNLACGQGSSEAYLIRALRLLLLMPTMNETFWAEGESSTADVTEKVAELWRQSENIHPSHKFSEEKIFENKDSLRKILGMSEHFSDLIANYSPEYIKRWENFSKLSRAFCPSAVSGIDADFLKFCLESRYLEANEIVVQWVVLRSRLADLEEDVYAYLWHEAALKVQLYWPSAIEQMSGDKVARRPLKAGIAAIQAVARSTAEVGPVYNSVGVDGIPIPGTRGGRADGVPRGWGKVNAVILKENSFEVVGEEAGPGSVPLIFNEDIDALLILVWLEKADPSLSLEFIAPDSNAWLGSEKFYRKVWNPPWLSETLIGKTFYYADYLLNLDHNGRSNFSIFDPFFTAEAARKWTSPELWRLADNVGGSANVPRGRLAHIPMAIRGETLRSIEWGRGAVSVPVPSVRAGVEGSVWASHLGADWEDRRFADGNLRFQAPRSAAVFSHGFPEMVRQFPVYARTEAIFGVHAGLTRALDAGVRLGDAMAARLANLKSEFATRRQRRLDKGGVDVVLSGR